MKDVSNKGWTNLQSASMKGWANIQTLVNQSGESSSKSLTSGASTGGGYGSVNGVSAVNSAGRHDAENWDWDNYAEINGEEDDDEGINVEVTKLEGDDEDNNGEIDSWAWGSDSESPKQKSPPATKNGASWSTKQASKTATGKKTKPEAVTRQTSDGWGDLISWENDEWGESSGWSNEDWKSNDGKSKIATAGGKGGKKAD